MTDYLKRLREEALAKERDRKTARREASRRRLDHQNEETVRQVARFLEVAPEMVDSCCGSICPDCDMFLDKAIALVELGHPPHLFMNPTQEDLFGEAVGIFRDDRKEYEARKRELMDRMR